MGGDFKVTDFKTNTLQEVINYASEIYQRFVEKQEMHNEYVKNLPIFESAKNQALVKYKAAQAKYKGKPNSILSAARAQYCKADSAFRYAEIDVQVSGMRADSERTFYQKMSGPAAIAQSMLG